MSRVLIQMLSGDSQLHLLTSGFVVVGIIKVVHPFLRLQRLTDQSLQPTTAVTGSIRARGH